MALDIRWSQFLVEIGLAGLAVACLVLDLVLPQKTDKGRLLGGVAMAGTAALLAALAFRWGDFGMSLGGVFVQDGFSFFFKALFLAIGVFVLQMVREYQASLKKGHSEFVILVLIGLIGMCFLVSANEFLLFFVALETLTVSLYIITAYLRDDDRSIEAGLKFLVLGALSTVLMVYGLSFITGATGSTTYIGIQEALTADGPPPAPFLFGMALVLASLAFKVAVFPFHSWVPDVYEGAPAPVTAFLAMGSKAAGFAGLSRLMMTVFMPAQSPKLTLVLAVLAALTVVYGNLAAIPQRNVKRLLAYSSIGHAGYLLMAMAAFWHTGKEAMAFYLASYTVSSAGAFLTVVWISNRLKSDDLIAYAGLSRRSPLLAAGMLLAVFSLAGVPPLAGFFAKFYVLSAAVRSGMVWLAAIGAVNVVTSLYYYLKIVKAMYVDEPADASPLRVSISHAIVQYAAIAGMLFIGVYPGPLVALVDAAFLSFLRF